MWFQDLHGLLCRIYFSACIEIISVLWWFQQYSEGFWRGLLQWYRFPLTRRLAPSTLSEDLNVLHGTLWSGHHWFTEPSNMFVPYAVARWLVQAKGRVSLDHSPIWFLITGRTGQNARPVLPYAFETVPSTSVATIWHTITREMFTIFCQRWTVRFSMRVVGRDLVKRMLFSFRRCCIGSQTPIYRYTSTDEVFHVPRITVQNGGISESKCSLSEKHLFSDNGLLVCYEKYSTVSRRNSSTRKPCLSIFNIRMLSLRNAR